MKAVGISGINATDNPGPGTAVAKSLRKSGCERKLIGLGYDAGDPGHYLPQYFDHTALMPFPCHGWEGMREQLQRLQQEQGLDIVIPCLDAELPLFIHYQDQLAAMGIRSLLPTQEQFDLRKKENLTPLADAMGCTYPKTLKTFSAGELLQSLEEIPLPAFVKGPYYKAKRMHNVEQALYYQQELANEWGWPVLLQQEVFGEEVNVIGLGDGEGGDMGLVAIKKTTTSDLGKITSGVTLKHEKLLEVSRRFCAETKWRGPFELEFIDAGTELHLIEVNPRFPAWVFFASAVGINLPQRLIQWLDSGDCERHSDYPAGKLFIRYSDEVVCDLADMHQLISKGNTVHV